MGFNATVVVLLDRLGEIERDPDFGKKLASAIRYQSSFGNAKPNTPGYRYAGNEATGQTQVIEVHHADYQMVVAVGGNTGHVIGLGGGYRAEDDDMIKRLNSDRLRRNKEAASMSRTQSDAHGNADLRGAESKPCAPNGEIK